MCHYDAVFVVFPWNALCAHSHVQISVHVSARTLVRVNAEIRVDTEAFIRIKNLIRARIPVNNVPVYRKKKPITAYQNFVLTQYLRPLKLSFIFSPLNVTPM